MYKRQIIDLIEPHECEGFAVKSNIDERPTVLDVIEGLKDLSKTTEALSQDRHSGFRSDVDGDKRERSRISSAPASLLGNINSVNKSDPRGDIDGEDL